MACSSSSVRPFSPDEAYGIVHQLQQPAVFLNMTKDWPVLQWTAAHLSHCLQGKLVKFRLGRKEETNTPLFETQCSFVNATLGQFLRWTEGRIASEEVGPFCDYLKSEYWAYADYKYIAEVLEDQPSMFEDVRWSDFGFRGRDGRDSTLWIGTAGANTPCHLDSYGCNLVLQVQGRKRWHLFSPEDSLKLYPTRIPYEESSVFSRVDVLNPDLNRFKDFTAAKEHCVTLLPGQVLFVPRHWWHYVESVDPVTVSINSWIELEVDDEARISEAVTRAIVCAFKTAPSEDNTDDWLNPTEAGVTSHSENMEYLSLALSSFSQRHSMAKPLSGDILPSKRHCTGHILPSHSSLPLPPSFGPHLIPVNCQPPIESSGVTCKHSRKCAKTSQKTEADVGLLEGEEQRASLVICDGEKACPEERKEANEELVHVTLSTNDLLDCLLHPDVIERVTQLLIQRHTGAQRTQQMCSSV